MTTKYDVFAEPGILKPGALYARSRREDIEKQRTGAQNGFRIQVPRSGTGNVMVNAQASASLWNGFQHAPWLVRRTPASALVPRCTLVIPSGKLESEPPATLPP